MATERVFRMDELADPIAAKIEVGGVVHDVLAFDGFDYEWLKTLSDATPMPELYAKAAKIVPTLAEHDQHMRLGRRQLIALVMLGASGIDAVEKLFPNGVSPEGRTSPG